MPEILSRASSAFFGFPPENCGNDGHQKHKRGHIWDKWATKRLRNDSNESSASEETAHEETLHKPDKPDTKGRGAKETVNRIVAKINSAASCGRNERDLPMVVEIEAELEKEKIGMREHYD